MTKSDEVARKAAKYGRVERASDSLGRVIGLKRLNPAQRNKVKEFSPLLSGSTKLRHPETGMEIEIPDRVELILAASVCEIDDVQIPFARTREELDAILNRLDDEGIAAATEAYAKFGEDEVGQTDPLEEAKNLPASPS